MSNIPDSARVSALIRDVAEAEIMPRFKQLAEAEIWHKRPGSVVTVADQESEAKLGAGLRELLPGSVVVGEEGAEEDPGTLERLGGDAPVWIVDPLDGTANFADGKPLFAVIVALSHRGETVAGWIHDPVNGYTAMAEKGGGAWKETVAGERTGLSIAPLAAAPEGMKGSLGGRLRRDTDVADKFAAVANMRCCGVEYLSLLQGALHFAHYRRLKPWDHAAGYLIHAEAGGFGACLDDTAYDPRSPAESGLLMAPDRAAWDRIADLLRPALATLS